jgi:hypothetical protein
VSEGLKVIALGIGYLVIFGAVGSGPACLLLRDVAFRLLLAPVIGLSICAMVLTTASPGLTMHAAAWLVVVPLAVASLLLAAWTLRRTWERPTRSVAVPILLLLAGLLLASAPALARGTVGPFGLGVYDALGYVQTDLWLQGHTLLDDPPADAGRWDLSLTYGHALTQDNTRIGVSLVNAALSSLLGLSPDETLYALLAVLFALLPVTIWVVARRLGASPAAAAFGACFGLSPALFTLVADSALGNLTALVLAPAALVFALRGLEDRDVRELLLAAILLGGLISVYPEFVAPVAIVALVGAAMSAARARSWEGIRSALMGGSIVLATIAVTAPLSAYRALSYLSRIEGDSPLFSGLPPRFMTFENSGAWAFGLLHVYQLQRWDLLSTAKVALAVALPIALAGLVAVGAFRSVRLACLVAVPILVSIALGLLAYRRYQGGHCEYCLWKSLTFMLPFLGVGLALGLDAVWRMQWRRTAARAAVALLAVVALAVVARTDVKLARAVENSPAAGDMSLKELDDAHVPLPHGAHVLVEGAEAGYAPKWTVPDAYYAARSIDNARPSLPLARDDALYLGAAAGTPPRQFYDPGYGYVLSAFPGVRSERKPLAISGGFGVFRRAPTDVAIVGANSALDPSAGSDAIPWLLTPLQLWVSSRQAGPAAIVIHLRHGTDARPLLQLREEGNLLTTFHSRNRSEVCAEVSLVQGLTILTAVPDFPSQAPAGRATEEDPLPAPRKLLGIGGIDVRERCPASLGQAVRLGGFGLGWFPAQRDGTGAAVRWMGSRSTLTLGAEGAARPAFMLRAKVTALLRRRVLTVRLNGRRVRRVEVPPYSTGFRALKIEVPAGHGRVTLAFRARPGAEPASQVTPGDTRMLAVLFSGLEVRQQ